VCDTTAEEDVSADVVVGTSAVRQTLTTPSAAAGDGVATWTGATRTLRAGEVVDAAAAAAAAADAATETASCDHKPGKQQGPTNLPTRAAASNGGDKQLP
jgi:hypothetical protein